MKIIYYVHDLSFPLVEGYRKQAWLLARAFKAQGHDVEIVSTSNKKELFIKDGIKIKYGSPFSISKVRTDILHYISQPTPYLIPLLLRAKAKRQIMTIFEGNLHNFWERPWDKLLSRLVNKKIKRITVQTSHQMELLNNTRLDIPTKIIPPLAPASLKNQSRTEIPSLLYMSHMEELKGINDVIDAFLLIRDKFQGKLQLVIADSGMTKNSEVYERINKINRGDIIIKNIVNPSEELAKAWVYLYPIKSPRETFSVPLSLIEAMQVGTPYISTNVGGIPEYFNSSALVPPSNPQELAKKIEEFIGNPVVYPLKKEINNKDVLIQFAALYDIPNI